ncbi:MAG: beta-propeller fold lactonase family protein [Phycisphaerales bacterium]|nr:beta-propeller fold lactonase family protein [Phycisphaerales bacterium]
MRQGVLCISLLLVTASTEAQGSFVNWETPHVHPLDITPDGARLVAVNLADARLEIFEISLGTLIPMGSVPVGIDPVSVRVRTNSEAWVVNQISDTVSVIDLNTANVVRTLKTDDEPADVVFATGSQRAFVSCSQADSVLVYDLTAMDAPPTRIAIEGEDPRALVYNAARNEVCVAVFESGNRSTILGGGSTMANGFPPNVVSNAAGPYNGTNPPPNDGPNFNPPQKPGNPPPPAVGLVVKQNGAGLWMDDNNGDWTDLVSGANAALSGRIPNWELIDNDVAIIDASTLDVRYATGLMNICMAIGVNPGSGDITVVGTDATNQVRFEPVLQGRFLRVNIGRVDAASGATIAVADLNPHLTYGTTIPFTAVDQSERDKSLGDPRAIVWNAAGSRGYIAGMGSNNIVIIDDAGTRVGRIGNPNDVAIDVGAGPTGLVLDEANSRLYALNKFSGSISVIDLATESVIDDVPFHDATVPAIKIGRKHLYDTHKNSGLGHIACASCHVDARMDRLAWDLGDPSGDMKTFNQNCAPGNNCQDWHPMKGPMTTQTLQDIIGLEPHHWRGDRTGIEEFADAFEVLQGDDQPLPANEMQEFENFLGTIHFPPNPYRNFDNTLPTSLPLPGHITTGRFGPAGQPLPNGNAVNGLNAYRTAGLDGVQCVTCHTLPTGAGPDMQLGGGFPPTFVPVPVGPDGEHHLAIVSVDGSTNVSIKIPQLRNQYDKVGFNMTQPRSRAGFGVLHDGSVDSIERFVNEPVFGVTSDQMTADLVALMLAFAGSDLPQGSPTNLLEPPGPFSQDTHAAVGSQLTLADFSSATPDEIATLNAMEALADTGAVGLIVRTSVAGEQRGARYAGLGVYQTDRAGEMITSANLRPLATPGSEQTYTIVVAGMQTRLGVDRDEDGFFDRDEVDACSDPADAASTPILKGDMDGSGIVDTSDIPLFGAALLSASQTPAQIEFGDTNCDGALDGRDVQSFTAILTN